MRHTRSFVTTAALALGLVFAVQAQPHNDRRGPVFHGPGPGHAGPVHGVHPHQPRPPHGHARPPHRPPHHAGGPGWGPQRPPHGAMPPPPGWRPPPPPPHGWRPPPPPPPPHAGYGHMPPYRWAPGVRVPHEYRTARYRVNNWRRHGLYAPPHGHYWVQHGADYLLVAVTTGIIASLIVGAH